MWKVTTCRVPEVCIGIESSKREQIQSKIDIEGVVQKARLIYSRIVFVTVYVSSEIRNRVDRGSEPVAVAYLHQSVKGVTAHGMRGQQHWVSLVGTNAFGGSVIAG